MDDLSTREITRLPTPAPSDSGWPSTSTSYLALSPSFSSTPLPPSASGSSTYLSPNIPTQALMQQHALPKSRSALSLNLTGWESGAQSRFISALPSPSLSNAGSVSDFAECERDMDSTPGGGGNKTSSFFSASFAATPPPPPLSILPQRSVSVSVRGKHADGQILGLSSSPAYRSISAERSPARADSMNAIFYTPTGLGSMTPAPPPALRPSRPASPPLSDEGDTGEMERGQIAGPSQPRVSLELYEDDLTPKAEAALRRRDRLRRISGHAHSLSGGSPSRRKIILLDEPSPYTTSPDGSPVRAPHAHTHEHEHSHLHEASLLPEKEFERPRSATINNGAVGFTFAPEKPLPPTPFTAPADMGNGDGERQEKQEPEHHAPHLHREPHSTLAERVPHEPLHRGASLVSDDLTLTLVRVLGQGAFSSVWLARDSSGALGGGDPKERRKSESWARMRKDRKMAGLSPGPRAPSGGFFSGRVAREEREGSVVLDEEDGEGGSAPGRVGEKREKDRMLHVPGGGGVEERKEGRLVAVKCLDRAMCDANDRTRISFVREVEVLRHVCHPSIVSYLHSFTTVTHHCLVLEYLAGGELFSLLDNDDKYRRMTEPLVRRMFGELVRAVGWMHGVALVHRDIKLENILLTCDPFLISSYPSLDDLPTPLLKLSDFGLSRFIDPAKPLLQTRCGSESYAAPEIVMGQKYDGRQTDAWACGVVLYALATRVLPFDPNATDAHAGTGGSFRGGREGRKALLFRIAKGDYSWPKDPRPSFPVPDMLTPHGTIDSDPVRSLNLATPGLKHVVARLLVRDPAKRAKVIELWDDEWMQGPGAPAPPHRDADSKRAELVDGDSIGEIARNEVV